MTQLDLLIEAGAEVSDDGRYRHVLWRTWDPDRPALGWIMLNPSTADGHVDDPTVRRCIGFARRDGFGGIRVVNLFDLRATDPSHLLIANDPVGPDADPWGHLGDCPTVVAGWGAVHPHLQWRAADVDRTGDAGRLWCLGTTVHGHPRHPLYLRADTPLKPWRPEGTGR